MIYYVTIKQIIATWREVQTVIKSWCEVKWKIELMHDINRDIEYEQESAVKTVTPKKDKSCTIVWSEKKVFVRESAILARQGKFEK